MSKHYSVMLIGAGAMGGALLRGWLAAGLLNIRTSCVVDPAPSAEITSLIESAGLALNPPAEMRADICVLAVKPQALAAVVPQLAWPRMDETLFLSVAAGQSASSLHTHLKETPGADAPVIRAMPNLPVSVGQGMTVLYAEDGVDSFHRDAASALMQAVGETCWVAEEALIDVGTAVAGSGPAYAFFLVEAMAEAGEQLGLSAETAAMLARQTVIGAGALLAEDSRSAGELRQSVTSPGGTTEAALTTLQQSEGLKKLMAEAIRAANARAQELNE